MIHPAFFLSVCLRCPRSGNFAESRGEIKFPEISTHILEKVIQYLYYKVRLANHSQEIKNTHMYIYVYMYIHQPFKPVCHVE